MNATTGTLSPPTSFHHTHGTPRPSSVGQAERQPPSVATCPFHSGKQSPPHSHTGAHVSTPHRSVSDSKDFDGEKFDARLLDPETLQRPYALYSDLGICKPVFWSKAMSRWLVCTHEHVREVLTDTKRFSSQLGEKMFPREHWLMMRPVTKELSKMMIFSDAASHQGLKCIMRHVFDARVMKSLSPVIEETTHRILETLPRRTELLTAYSETIPVAVISHALGIPRKDIPKLHKMATQWVTATASYGNRTTMLRGLKAMWGLHRYFVRLNAKKRKQPGDDVVSRLVQMQSEYGLSDDVIVAQVILLFVTGHETVQSTIASGCYLLSQHPEVVKEAIAGNLSWKQIVEEVLRFESPAQATMRIATEDTDIAGISICAGDGVVAGIAAANRDPAVFENPDNFNPQRKPNRHLAFGVGSHTCPAAMLGREEIRVGLSTLFERYPDLRVECTPSWTARHNFRTVVKLPVTLW